MFGMAPKANPSRRAPAVGVVDANRLHVLYLFLCMLPLYLFALLLGGGLLAFSLFGGDATPDGGLDLADTGDTLRWLSLRTLTYFLFVFGGVGAALTVSWHVATAPLIAGLSAVAGVGVASVASAAFRYLRRTDSGATLGDDRYIGLSARVVVPFGDSGAGKVLVSRADRTVELMARPFSGAAGDPQSWRDVIVVEMDRGTALVAPLDDPAQRDSSLVIEP